MANLYVHRSANEVEPNFLMIVIKNVGNVNEVAVQRTEVPEVSA